MRLAVPLYGEDIAPRFCAADRILLVDVDAGREASRRVIEPPTAAFAERLLLLGELDVREMLCGGFNRRFLPMANGLGILVTWGLCGNADEAVRGFLDRWGEPPGSDPQSPGGVDQQSR